MMKLALIGHGAMGRLVDARARDEGHQITLVITSRDGARSLEELIQLLRGSDVAIDFSVSGAVLTHITACARAGVPLVEGTTGWNTREAEARRTVLAEGGALVYGANFSIGVNLFYRIVERAADLFKAVDDYAPFIEEAHHVRKRDAPSGTALRLRDLLAARLAWDIPIASTRAGYIPGTHRVGFDSHADQITLTHTARTREGFAAGALAAARWIRGKQGVYEFSEMIDQILKEAAETQGHKEKE
ncbi:MAG TPA: dihydrodipicolinate reductase C-terminal domain-containing protein [Pyrinomonadaceae bacterium]|nr:dihydrodipicolinate reductase C-terminal domain-containing protein [Pyrinomonadaceae bacterium]